MSHKTRLTKLEKIALVDTLWALIGIGKPRDIQHQRLLETQARDSFYASGGNRSAYLAFLPFDCSTCGFIGYLKRSELNLIIMNKAKNPAEVNGTPSSMEPKA